MITLKTKTQFPIPHQRGVRNEFIYLTVERLEIDNNNVIPIGYYYFIEEIDNGEGIPPSTIIYKLDDIARTPVLWNQVEMIEDYALDPLISTKFLKENLLQRLEELTFARLEQEGTTNYGATYTDFEVYNP